MNSEQASKESFETTPEVNANQSVLPRMSYNLYQGLLESPPESLALPLGKNEDVLSLLNMIIARLEKLEQNQTKMLNNQSVLRNGQAAIMASLKRIANALEKLEATIVIKPEMMALGKIMKESKVAIKRLEQSLLTFATMQ